MLRHFEHQPVAVLSVSSAFRISRQMAVELDVHHRAGDLRHPAQLVARHGVHGFTSSSNLQRDARAP